MFLDSELIKNICKELGAEKVGIASIDRFINAPQDNHPKNLLPSCRSVIVMGCSFPEYIIDTEETVKYTNIRNGLVKTLNALSKDVAKTLKKAGYDAKSIISTGGVWKQGHFWGPISLKHAGELAGLGRITKNYLLTNDEYGNLLWLNAVLTSLELAPDPLSQYTVCNDCYACVENCRSSALENEALFDQKACRATCYKTIKGKLELKCWECRRICPYCYGKLNTIK